MFRIILLCALISTVLSASSSYHRTSDGANISVEDKCITISTRSNEIFQLCCADKFPKDIILPYFDVRSGIVALKASFQQFTDGKRNCIWDEPNNRRGYYNY